VTEIPEHLLKRAAARRAAASGGAAPADTPADAAAPQAAGAPATSVAKAAKAPAPIPTLDEPDAPPTPELAVVTAARSRKRIPYWAAPVLAVLPLWAFLYMFAVRPPPAGANDPLVLGKAVYTANCASCHLADGSGVKGGGVGQQLNDGHVLKTFADPLAQVHWIAFGASGGARPDGTYGDKTRPGGAMNVNTLSGVMPAFASTLSPEDLAAVVIYLREGMNTGKPADDKKFNTETFTASPSDAAATVTEVTNLGKGGDPDLTKVKASESSK
jgi:mono/diheme cytochrome c family protein